MRILYTRRPENTTAVFAALRQPFRSIAMSLVYGVSSEPFLIRIGTDRFGFAVIFPDSPRLRVATRQNNSTTTTTLRSAFPRVVRFFFFYKRSHCESSGLDFDFSRRADHSTNPQKCKQIGDVLEHPSNQCDRAIKLDYCKIVLQYFRINLYVL